MTNEKQPQRHRPTHHAPVECFNEPVIVQVNVCTKDRQPVLACEAGHRLCREIWQATDFWRVGQYTIMLDHIHLFCAPGRAPMPGLRQWVEFWKSRIAARWPIQADDTEVVPPGAVGGGSASVRTGIAKPFKLWQRDFWDTQMRSHDHYEEKLSYVRMNPVRKELVKTPEDWPYQGVIHEIAWM